MLPTVTNVVPFEAGHEGGSTAHVLDGAAEDVAVLTGCTALTPRYAVVEAYLVN